MRNIKKHYKENKFQKEAFKRGLFKRSYGLFMHQGTGKTMVAIALAGHRHINYGMTKMLVVCPLTVISEWERQFKEMATFDCKIYYDVNTINDDYKGLKVLVVGYRNVWEHRKKNKTLKDGNVVEVKQWIPKKAIMKWAPEMVICDESHKIKGRNSIQSKAMAKISKVSKYRMILTGTPVANGPDDLFSQFRFLNPNVFGTSFTYFRNEFCKMGGFQGKKIMGLLKEKEKDFINLVYNNAYRVSKEEAIVHLPPVFENNVFTTLEKKAQKYYDEMKKESIVILEDDVVTAPIVLTQIIRLQQITGGFLKGEEKTTQVSKAKINALKETIQDLLEEKKDRKIAIFARFSGEIKIISELLTKMKLSHTKLEGSTKRSARPGIIFDFQNKVDPRVLVIQISTGGEGITLTKADTIIFYSLDFSLISHEQAKARIHRMGQNSYSVNYVYIIIKNTIDEKIRALLDEKKATTDYIINELRKYIISK